MRFGLNQDGEEARLRTELAALIGDDMARMTLLRAHRRLVLPDSWIGAGFARNAVWDSLHGHPPAIHGDIDVVWFDPRRIDPDTDRALEAQLRGLAPEGAWSVRNQARMHRRNGDPSYRSTADAMRFWPETATAVALRLTGDDRIEVLAPFGLFDLFTLRLRPTPAFRGDRRSVFERRVRERGWLRRWPGLRVSEP